MSPYFPCDVSNNFPGPCYSFLLARRYKTEEYQDVAEMCLDMTDLVQRRGCFFGYGVRFSQGRQ